MNGRASDRPDDPVDLILRGNLEAAIQRYLDMYLDSLREGDRFIGPDLCAQLLYSVAASQEIPAEEAVRAVRMMLEEGIKRRELQVESSIVADDLEAARNSVLIARKRADRSVERVEREKERRWQE